MINSIIRKQNAYAVLVILLSLASIYFLIPPMNYQPHGIAYSLKPGLSTPLNAEAILIYDEKPSQAEVIGRFNVEMFLSDIQATNKAEAFAYTKKLAAQLGANAVVFDTFGPTNHIMLIHGVALLL